MRQDSKGLSQAPSSSGASYELIPRIADVYIGLATVRGYK